MTSINFKSISKSYATNQVVKNLSLSIKDKEFVVLVGPSGCGKSTTLRMLAGLEEITSGELFIGERLVNDIGPKDRNIAMVFQNYALYPHMSVYDNMAFSLKLNKFSKHDIKRRVKEAADILELGDLLERKPTELSGGQRQRVAMGRAIVRKPDVFLFDEPLSNLDAKLRNQMRAEIKLLHEKIQTTIVYVTHDQIEAMTLADRIVVMNNGIIEQVGTPWELYQEPANTFVASFIGSPPMNILEAQVNKGLIALGDATLSSPFYYDGKVLLGMRPDKIIISEEGVAAVVEMIEYTGQESLYHILLGSGDKLIAKGPQRPLKRGDSINFTIDKNDLHLFDYSSGARLSGESHV